MKSARSARRLLFLSATLLAAACSRGEAAAPAPAKPSAPTAAAAAVGKSRLVFFMNPNGGPCQMQDGILRQMAGELGGVEVVRYRTTDEADLAKFEQYGIRSLPTLIVTDATGRELRRATPGIQSAESVRALLAP